MEVEKAEHERDIIALTQRLEALEALEAASSDYNQEDASSWPDSPHSSSQYALIESG